MKEEKKAGSGVHIFINRRKIEIDSAEVTGEQLLAMAGFTGKDWDLLRLQGEGDPTGGTLVQREIILDREGNEWRIGARQR